MNGIRVSKKPAVGLLALLSVAGLLSAACGGGDGAAQAQQAPAATVQSSPAVRATSAPAAVPTAAATPAPTPVPATPAPTDAPPAPAATEAPPAPTVNAAPAPPAPADVNITLSEFKIESSLTTFQAGVPYHFIITNKGVIPHETNFANLNAAEVPVGATKTLDVTFPQAGPQEFACHLPGHYQVGMKLPVTIGP